MDNRIYIKVGSLFNIAQAIPESATGNTCTLEIRRLSDGYTWNFSTTAFQNANNTGSMTFVNGIFWKQSFTPPTEDTYLVTITNSTLDVKYAQVLQAVGIVSAEGLTGDELTTLENLKEYLRIETTDDDTLLQKIITRTSDWIQKYCARNFIAQDYTEQYNGDGTNTLLVKQYPVNSIASAYDDTSREFGADTAITVSELVIDDGGIIIFDTNRFSAGYKNVKITYNAGYATIPQDLEEACLKLCASNYLLGQGAINVVEGVIVDKPKRLKTEAMETIDYYRRIDVGV